ncbi:MAG TPA: type II CAAX endopeptidase family protein [Candidatus Nanopelagicales bacterium]|nr:type II CAAX endopeptidase family protein [Candidatus Nanopelagicales bacterium]
MPGEPLPVGVPSALAYAGAPATYVEALEQGVALRPPRWGLKDVLIAILTALILPTVILGVLIVGGAARGGGPVLLASLTLPWLGFGLYPWWATRVQGNGPKVDLGFTLRLSDLGWGIGGGIAATILAGLVATLTERVFGSFDSAAGSAIESVDAPRWVLYAALVCAVVGAPLFEELCFRGLAFAAIAKWADAHRMRAVPWATIGSAALFGAIHLEPVRFPLLFVIGLVLSWLRARTGRVGASVVAHALNNLIAVSSLFG